MEPADTPVVELEDSEDLDIRLGVEIAESDVATPDDAALDPTGPPVPSRLAVGHAVVFETFLDDAYYASQKTQMRQPPRILVEDGIKFLRIFGSAGDYQSIPTRLRPQRTRSTVTFTSHFMSMPLTEPHNQNQTYEARLRVSPPCPNGCSVFEMFQAAPGGEAAYGTQNGTGPAARFIVLKGRMKFETRYRNETRCDTYDLGVDASQWHTYRLDAVWSHNPSISRFDVFVDDKLSRTVRGRDCNLGPASNRNPMVKLGLYGDHVTGYCDVDHLYVYPTGMALPGQPPTQPPIVIEPPPLERITRAANCGAPAAYTATDGTVYAKDKGFAGGRTERMPNPIAGTEDVPLYQSWRYGKKFEYSAPFANGTYTLTLHFAEHLHTEPGKRVFDVDVEGQPVLTRLDVFAQVGPKTAHVVEIPVTVTDGALTVAFEALVGNAMVSAIKVAPR